MSSAASSLSYLEDEEENVPSDREETEQEQIQQEEEISLGSGSSEREQQQKSRLHDSGPLTSMLPSSLHERRVVEKLIPL
jgi:hypothetical protein